MTLALALRRPSEVGDGAFDAALRLHQSGDLVAARRAYERILDDNPADAESLNNLGLVAEATGDLAKALDLVMRAANSDTATPLFLSNTGQILVALGQYPQALEAFRIALLIDPRDLAARLATGAVLRHLERWTEAERFAFETVAALPRSAAAFDHLGITLAGQGKLEASVDCFRQAIRYEGHNAGYWNNLGCILALLADTGGAVEAFRNAVALAPDNADCRFHLGMALLRSGDLRQGWREHEWRWRSASLAGQDRPFAMPRWDGAASPHTILLHGEQGLGDALQFCRYAPLVAARGHRVILEAAPELMTLLRDSFVSDRVTVVPRAIDFPGIAGLPEADAHCPLMSLPLVFDTVLETIPGEPYLRADAAKAEAWRARLAALPGRGPAIGLVWAGAPRHGHSFGVRAADRRRSISFADFLPLLGAADCRFVSLQKGEAASQLAGEARIFDPTAELRDFADTAALVEALDLVITVDTSVAHLAGGMGKPVWMLSRFDGCWRWLEDRADTPWYPGMRIFRQGADRSWGAVVAAVRDALYDAFQGISRRSSQRKPA